MKTTKVKKSVAAKPLWSIDRNNLDAECVLYPEQLSSYVEQLPDAKEALDKAESNLKLVAAEMDAKIRAKPGRYGLEKVTEAGIKVTIPGTSEYLEAEEKVRRAKHHLDTLQVALDVLRAKKSSLEFLVQLHQMAYFSTPSTKIKSRT